MRHVVLALCAGLLLAACHHAGGWSAEQQGKFVKACTDKMPGVEAALAGKYCGCVLAKLQKKYRTYEEADKSGTTAEGEQLGMSCLGDMGIKVAADDNGKPPDGSASLGRQIFMQSCLPEALKGLKDQQRAQAYCDCTAKDIEEKYGNYEEAQRKMTDADLKPIAQKCLSEEGSNSSQ